MKHPIEIDFPIELIDKIAEVESYRKEVYRPIYHIHKWWAKRLGSVFRSIVSGSLAEGDWVNFYKNQDYSNKVVLDPFMGSGTTLGEAAKLGARVIGCDVNPISTFLVQQSMVQVDESALIEEFESIEADVKHTILSYYKTESPHDQAKIQALYFFWVKVVLTPDGEEIPLFSSYVFSKNAYPKKKPEAKILCPSCGEILIGRYDSKSEICKICNKQFNPQQGPAKSTTVIDSSGRKHKIKNLVSKSGQCPKHRLYAIMALDKNNKKFYKKPSLFDFQLYEKATKDLKQLESKLPLPNMMVRHGHNTNQAKGYCYNQWRDFFNDRQLLCLGILLRRIISIKNKTLRNHFICLFSGTLEFNNLFCSFKGEGTGAVRHMFSHHILKPERTVLENTVWGTEGKSSGSFCSLFKSRLLKAKRYLKEPFELKLGKDKNQKVVCSKPINLSVVDNWDSFEQSVTNALIFNGDSSNLSIPSNSVDAVITDPPYFDFINYSELSDFFYAWLSPALGEDLDYFRRDDSSHENEVQDSDTNKFSTKIGTVFKECYRTLKSEGLLCFSFHHSSIDGWLAIYDALANSEFVIVAAHPIKAEMSVASPKSGAKDPINLDAILVCKKTNTPPKFKKAVSALQMHYENYIHRFETIGRKLSKGDRFVIACSQAMVIASCKKMSSSAVQALFITASELPNATRNTQQKFDFSRES